MRSSVLQLTVPAANAQLNESSICGVHIKNMPLLINFLKNMIEVRLGTNWYVLGIILLELSRQNFLSPVTVPPKITVRELHCGLLRVRVFFHKTVRVCHVYCNFKIGFTCWITVIFGTLKDGSLLINTLASNICFSYRNMFQNGVDALSKIVDAFLSKSSKFHLVRIIR